MGSFLVMVIWGAMLDSERANGVCSSLQQCDSRYSEFQRLGEAN